MNVFFRWVVLLVLACAHSACTAVDRRVQDAVVTQNDGLPCFAVQLPDASVLELAGLAVNARSERGISPVWEIYFPSEKDGGDYLRSVKCLAYGTQPSTATVVKKPETLRPGLRYEVDLLTYALTSKSKEMHAYNFKANFCVRLSQGRNQVRQVHWIDKEDRWDWSICE
jgi:hypothetical protein